jgi:hypothetical protein
MNRHDTCQEALDRLQIAEAELAALKQELVLQHLIDTREPTEEARRQLQRLREIVDRLTTRTPDDSDVAA